MRKSLCICISTYNREKKIIKLVKEILQCKCGDFEVVVVDDCSTDNTVQRLKDIWDERLYIYKNDVNQGAKKNWYLTLEKGRGKYLFQLLDRDWIRAEMIPTLIQTLKENEVVFGYAGWGINSDKKIEKQTEKVRIYEMGKQSLIKFGGVACHPTGVIFERQAWVALKNKKKYFFEDKYGIYPHGYIFTFLAQLGNSMLLDIDFCNHNRCIREETSQSRFYAHSTMNHYYWTPEASFCQTVLIAEFIDKMKFESNLKQDILIQRFQEDIQVATEEYRNVSMNSIFMKRYNVPVKRISKLELLMIALSFSKHYCAMAKKKQYNWFDRAFQGEIRHVMWQEMRKIICFKY